MTLEATPDAQAPVELVTLTIDGVEVSVPKGTLLIRAAEVVGIEIPRFCDHPLLEPVGACRQCLVDITDAGNGRGFPKPQASCTIEVAGGMVVETQVTSEVAAKAQRGNLEFLLVNHPLDCPVCDKGGECPLQNQAMTHGQGESRFVETKRTFPKPIKVSEQVLLDRERCVLCARCTRFSEQIAGDPFIALVERGAQQQIGIGPGQDGEGEPFDSYFSGNTIQICPVGALTSADYRFRSRPFDLVSTPSIAEHDSSGSAIRVDHRRGKVMRRLAGDDPEVNEEWITDKDRFAFSYATQDDRLRTPMVRNADGVLEPASWPGALAAAARGLAAQDGKVGVLTGGRLTTEDAFAYSTFARVVLGTHDIDFRSRAHSDEEAAFLASHVAGTGLGVTFGALEQASTVVLVGLEPEDEAGTVFLRLRKAAREHDVTIVSVASHTTRGLTKTSGTLVRTAPGREAEAVAGLELDDRAIVLVGERLATSPGAFSNVASAASMSGARVAWIPRRAGDRGAVEAGCLPGLLPGGRPVADAEARADAAAAWGVASLPAEPGRDTTAIVEALAGGKALTGLVVGGVELTDLPDPGLALKAVKKAAFVVSLEVRASDVTALADVVLPVAPMVERPGSFVSWEGRTRSFGAVLHEPASLTDIRVLAGIAEEMGRPLGFRTVAAARTAFDQLGVWDGTRATAPTVTVEAAGDSQRQVTLDTWRLLVDDGRGQDGQPEYKATARRAVIRASESTFKAFDVDPGSAATLTGETGRLTLPTEIADLPDGVVWAPGNSGTPLTTLGVPRGGLVTLTPAKGAKA